MTKREAEQFVRAHSDDDQIDEADLVAAFTALYGRSPDRHDHDEGLWSHCCAALT